MVNVHRKRDRSGRQATLDIKTRRGCDATARLMAMPPKPKKVRATVWNIREGIRLCEENTKRLSNNAKILLEHDDGSDGIVYVLWSLALEEYGKALLLQDQVDEGNNDEIVEVELSMDHSEKLARGLEEFPSIEITRLLRVKVNASSGAAIFVDPLGQGSGVVVYCGTSEDRCRLGANHPNEREGAGGTRRLQIMV